MSSIIIINQENVSTVDPERITDNMVIFCGDIRGYEDVVSGVFNNRNVRRIELNRVHLDNLNTVISEIVPTSRSLSIKGSVIDKVNIDTDATCVMLSSLRISNSTIETLTLGNVHVDTLVMDMSSYVRSTLISNVSATRALIEGMSRSLEIESSFFVDMIMDRFSGTDVSLRENVFNSSTFSESVLCSDFCASGNRFIKHTNRSKLDIDPEGNALRF